MKEKLFIGLICLIALTNISIAQQASLSLNAAFDKSEYSVGQPIKLKVTITNNGSENTRVRWATGAVTVESDGEIFFKRKGISGARGELKELKPGEFWSNELEYSSESFSMPTSGTYQVTIKYKNDFEKSGGPKKLDLWTGEVKTAATLNINN